MDSCVLWCKFVDLVDFLSLLYDPCLSCHSIHKTKYLRRPQYYISHTTFQRSPDTRLRLGYEKVKANYRTDQIKLKNDLGLTESVTFLVKL